MIYSNTGQAFSFHQIHTNHLKLNYNQAKKSSNKPQHSNQQNQSNHKNSMGEKIGQSVDFLKQRTINLVQVLRKFSLPSSLQTEIETYLTDVLDQMDFLRTLKDQQADQSVSKVINHEGQSFIQLQKPQGDQEDSYLQETLRQLPLKNNIEDATVRNQTLHKKIQNILQAFQTAQPQKIQVKDQEHSLFQIQQKSERVQTSNQSRIRGAHRFSNNYIRDIQKPKKNKLL